MTRKHYAAVAAAIKQLRLATDIRYLPNQSVADNEITASKLFGIRYAAEAVADAFADENPSFNRNIFLAACGLI